MAREAKATSLGLLARAGFTELSSARDLLTELAAAVEIEMHTLLDLFTSAADPDTALVRILAIADANAGVLRSLNNEQWLLLANLIGASQAFGDFFTRHPDRLFLVLAEGGSIVSHENALKRLSDAVSGLVGVPAYNALRVAYRELLARVMLYDLQRGGNSELSPEHTFDEVAISLSDLADAALDAALTVARANLISGVNAPPISTEKVAQTTLSIVAMGKCGARELNVVSDVDVIFIASTIDAFRVSTESTTADGHATYDAVQSDSGDVPDSEALGQTEMLRIATLLASETMRVIQDPAIEPGLWQVDPNLRPEGKQGALVRTLPSMMNYYTRWAKAWEFQALLKARAAAGDLELGRHFVTQTREMVWDSSSRTDFVGNVQRMRERVTEHIASEDLDYQLKLGPGGLRDIEFSVQLLQLVHGQNDATLHLGGTIPALLALVQGGYVARTDGDRLAENYRILRLLEHRLQLKDLRRTALMPREQDQLRILARATGLAPNAEILVQRWQAIKLEVRELHLKIFYAPLLNAVAALPGEESKLSGQAAKNRLAGIGFRDPDGALRHLAALTQGTSRAAKILRNLMPVILRWLGEGADPDFGLVSFRRVTEANRNSPWYLRLLRDGAEAAERLTRVLANSRFTAGLLETVPEAVAWLERDSLLQPAKLSALLEEMRALVSRQKTIEHAAAALRTVHRREVLRLALGRLVFVLDETEVAAGLDTAHTALLDGLLLALRDSAVNHEKKSPETVHSTPEFEIALIAMGRFGGGELGFASDLDLVAVYRAEPELSDADRQRVLKAATHLISELRRLVSDPRFEVDLDFELRPEGKNGPLVRSLDSYRAYYERWSLTWEAQALLRARHVAGDQILGSDFLHVADDIRYPAALDEAELREIRRLKARMEVERLPRGADPKRHLKLGPGGLSDVEWLIQLFQLQAGFTHAELRTVSTLRALEVSTELGLLTPDEALQLEGTWRLASQLRTAMKLWSGNSSNELPLDRFDLEGIASVMGLSPGNTQVLEEQWMQASRRSRQIFEALFFGFSDEVQPTFTKI